MATFIDSLRRQANVALQASALGLAKASTWFLPGTPVQPLNDPGTPPYRFDYHRNVNVFSRPRTELPNLRSYEEIRLVARLYAVNAACITTRIREMQGLRWVIKPRDKELQGFFLNDIRVATDFFNHPERDELTFNSWLAKMLRDRLEIDAMTLYRRPDRAGGLYALEVIDGATIKPILDEFGRIQGYQQYKSGVPANNFKRPSSEYDPEVPFYAKSDLLYSPYNVLTDSPYGMSPVEQAYELIKTLILKQEYDQAYFTEGNIPLVMINIPTGGTNQPSLESILAFQEKFEAILNADLEARNRALFQPYDAKITELKKFEYNTDLEKYALQITCAVHNMPPSELGITDDVNRASSDGQENLNYRKGIIPLAQSLKELFDYVIQHEDYLNFPALEWSWDWGETEDKKATADTDVAYINAGVFTPEEVKSVRQGYLTTS